ncbi:MAG: hypothetical protein GX763_00535 [Clostridiaceae bacterium]|nr:hypothetical protein [Clostridiaceae bacterium]
MEEILNGILNELHQISLSINSSQTIFDWKSIVSSFIGAAMATAFGIISGIFFEHRNNKRERKVAISLMCEELDKAIKLARFIKEHEYKSMDPIFDKYIVNDYYSKFASNLIDSIDRDYIEAAYIISNILTF